jgi:5-deoxy-glucuronate isomerase
MTGTEPRWFLPHGTARRDGCEVVIDDSLPAWQHTGLRVLVLDSGQSWSVEEQGWEYVVVPLAGAASVACTDPSGEQHHADLTGRASVFTGPTDVAYVPAGSRLTVTGTASVARIAVCAARVRETPAATAFRHVGAGEVPVELRGAGSCSREVRNFGVPQTLEADSIIACEVVTPAGNWSSYPPHKHDEERPGVETELEEIYYFETQVADGADVSRTGPVDPVGYQRVRGTVDGPSMAAPGYDLYYLNVMAGPGDERAWLICDDPSHGWVRETWDGQVVDPRLPLGGDHR